MTEKTSPENLQKLLDSENPATIQNLELLLSSISNKDSKKTNKLIAQIVNTIGLEIYKPQDEMLTQEIINSEHSRVFIGTLGSNITNLMKLDEEERQILNSKDLGDRLEYFQLITTCMNSHCGFPYFHGETDFYKPKNTSQNDYIHEHGFGEWEGEYCEDCLGNDLSGGVFGKIARLSKGKKRPPRIPWNLNLSRLGKEGKEVLNSEFPKATIEKSGKTKCKYSGKLIPKNNLRIEFKDFSILPEHIKEQYVEWSHYGVKPIFNDEGECVEVSEHSKKDKELLFKALLAVLELGRPSTKNEIEKAANLPSKISDSHIMMMLENSTLEKVETSEKLPFFYSFMEEWKMYINRTWCFVCQVLNTNKGNLPKKKLAELKKML